MFLFFLLSLEIKHRALGDPGTAVRLGALADRALSDLRVALVACDGVGPEVVELPSLLRVLDCSRARGSRGAAGDGVEMVGGSDCGRALGGVPDASSRGYAVVGPCKVIYGHDYR